MTGDKTAQYAFGYCAAISGTMLAPMR